MTESDDSRMSETETDESTQTARSIKYDQEVISRHIDDGTETAEEKSVTEETNQQQNNEEDDEFGDFEEATVSATTPVKEPDDPFPETPTKNINFGFAKFEDSSKLTPQRSFESPVSCLNITFNSINIF